MILDASVLIAVDRGTEQARDYLIYAERNGDALHTTAPVAAQVWRDGSRQVRLARVLNSITLHPFLPDDVARVGEARTDRALPTLLTRISTWWRSESATTF